MPPVAPVIKMTACDNEDVTLHFLNSLPYHTQGSRVDLG